MKIIRCVFCAFLFAGVVMGLTGCDWEVYGEDDRWNETGYEVGSFSGKYRAAQGALLVVDPSATNGASLLEQKGNSGEAIYSMNITQTGNRLAVLDSNGDRYTGVLAAVNGTSVITVQFLITGEGSKADVTIEGFLHGRSSGSVMTGRTIEGLWVEQVSGRVANLAGSASD